MRAVFTLEDDGDGIKAGIVYMGTDQQPGFSEGSHAHQHAALIVKILDRIAVKMVETESTKIITDEQVYADIDKAFDDVAAAESFRETGLEIPAHEPKDTRIHVAQLSVVRN